MSKVCCHAIEGKFGFGPEPYNRPIPDSERKLAMTLSASNGVPSEYVMPERSLIVHVLLPLDGVNDSAK